LVGVGRAALDYEGQSQPGVLGHVRKRSPTRHRHRLSPQHLQLAHLGPGQHASEVYQVGPLVRGPGPDEAERSSLLARLCHGTRAQGRQQVLVRPIPGWAGWTGRRTGSTRAGQASHRGAEPGWPARCGRPPSTRCGTPPSVSGRCRGLPGPARPSTGRPAQPKVPSRPANRPTFLGGARQPAPHAAAGHPEPAGDALHLGGRKQATPAQAAKASHSALPDLRPYVRLSAPRVSATSHVVYQNCLDLVARGTRAGLPCVHVAFEPA
jgi:hypothetical protein